MTNYRHRRRTNRRKIFDVMRADRVIYELEELDKEPESEDDY